MNPYAQLDPAPASGNPYFALDPATQATAPTPDFSGQSLEVATPFGNIDTHVPLSPTVDAYLAGAGKYVADKYAGVKGASGWVANKLGLIPDSAMAKINAENAAQESPADSALLRDPRAAGGYLGMGAVPWALAGAGVAPAMALGATAGALDPATSMPQRIWNAGVGGLASGATQGATNTIANLFAPAASGALSSALARARQFGINVSAGQAGQQPALQWIERGLQMFPGSAGVMQDVARGNDKAVGTTLARSIGQEADTITPDVLSNAASDLGAQFERYKSLDTPITFGPDYFSNVRSLADAESQLPKASQNPQVFNLVDSYAPASAMVPGAQPQTSMAQAIQARSRLAGDMSDSFKSGNSSLGQTQQSILNALDDAIQGSLGPGVSDAYAATRNQWRNLLAIQKAADPGATGNPSLLKIGTALRQQNPQAWARTPWGQDDLLDLARIGSLMKDSLGNSGTAQREGQLGTIATMVGGAMGGHEMAGDWKGAAAGAALPLGAWGLAKLYQTAPAQFAARTVFPGRMAAPITNPIARLLMQAGGSLGTNTASLLNAQTPPMLP